MDTVEEIEAAITRLLPEDYRRLAEWFNALEQMRWDAQIDCDSAAGRLDFLFKEAEVESAQGSDHNWPPGK